MWINFHQIMWPSIPENINFRILYLENNLATTTHMTYTISFEINLFKQNRFSVLRFRLFLHSEFILIILL
jgi:hypothetical protein